MATQIQIETIKFRPILFGFSVFALCWLTLLLYVGGLTTSIEAGMAFLDWPLSNGSLNPEGWTEDPDQLAEHSHRLIGMKMGMLSLALALGCQFLGTRPMVRRLAWWLLAVIFAQGMLGGLRVLLDAQNLGTDSNVIAQFFLISHATGAQVVLCLMVSLVLLLSPQWTKGTVPESENMSKIRFWAKASIGMVFIQFLLGAFIRHLKAAAIFGNHFPLLTADFVGFSSIIPDQWTIYTIVHYFHRVGAVVATVILLKFVITAWAIPVLRGRHGLWMLSLVILLAVQIFLGALVVWTLRNPHVATFHTLCGALLLANTWGLVCSFHRKPEVQVA